MYNKGITLINIGEKQSALECLNKAIELDPNFEPALKAKEDILDSKS
ncbi:MAG: tetratricopeptide repeat protein [Methanobacterium formicicum]